MAPKKIARTPCDSADPVLLLDKIEIGRRLGMNPETVVQKAKRGEIPCRRLGTRIIRFVWEEVLAAFRPGGEGK